MWDMAKTFKKMSQKKKFLFGSNFFFLRILELFFSRTRRQSLPLGRFRRGRATQKVDQAKTAARTRPWSMLRGHGPAVTASGECTRIMYAGGTEDPRSNWRGRPTNGVSDCLPPSWTTGPREELLPRIPDIFSWRFFLESAARTYTSVRLFISSTKSISSILTTDSWSPPQNYPDLKVSDQSEHFFKPGDISVPSPLFAFLRIRRLISTNLVETRALRTFFFFFQSIIIMAKDGGIKFSKTEGMGKSCPPPQK